MIGTAASLQLACAAPGVTWGSELFGPQLWRIVGKYSNISIFEVDSGDELHDLLSSLPLYPYMTIAVTDLAQHPSKLATGPT